MNKDDDIRNLFQQFGGQAEQYKEISRTEQSHSAQSRWPLLNAIRTRREPIPPSAVAEPAIEYAVQDTPASLPPLPEVHDHGEAVFITPAPHKLIAAVSESPAVVEATVAPTVTPIAEPAVEAVVAAPPTTAPLDAAPLPQPVAPPAPDHQTTIPDIRPPSHPPASPLKRLFGRLAAGSEGETSSSHPFQSRN